MTRRDRKTWATYLIFLTRPHPYMVSLLFVLILQAISLISMQVGGQPFVMDPEAMAAGDVANAVRFAPENLSWGATSILLALEVLVVVLRYGFQSFCLHAARMEKASYYDMMDGFMVFFRAILIWLLTGILVYFGTLALIVPGFILAYTYSMAPRLLLDHSDWSALRCMRESRKLMHGRKGDFFRLRLSLLGWTIMSAFPVTSVFAEPYIHLCETVFYLDATGDKSLQRASDASGDEKPPWEY